MTSGECVENKWFNMKYIGKYLSVEILLTHVDLHIIVITEDIYTVSIFSI